MFLDVSIRSVAPPEQDEDYGNAFHGLHPWLHSSRPYRGLRPMLQQPILQHNMLHHWCA
jgi:hypothetical protein